MYRQEGLSLIGTMEEKSKNTIYGMSLYYVADKNPTVEEARILLLRSLFSLLTKINSTPQAKKYLSPYPFTEKQINLSILFRNSKGQRPDHPHVAQVYFREGEICYESYSKNSQHLEMMQEESFDTAIGLIEKQMKEEGWQPPS